MNMHRWQYYRQSIRVVVGLMGLLLVTTLPASAQSACLSSGGDVIVEFLGAGTSNTILMQDTEGNYQGDIRVRVYCGFDGELIPNATVELTSTVSDDWVLDPETNVWTSMSTPVNLSLPTGERAITLRSTNPDLLSPENYRARVGTSTVTVTGAYNQVLSGNDFPMATGLIWAQTPELGSLALFGAGAAGLAGYGLTRLRAAKGGIGRRIRRR